MPDDAVTCDCGCVFLDTEGGRTAHVVVFGHQPEVAREAQIIPFPKTPSRPDSEAS